MSNIQECAEQLRATIEYGCAGDAVCTAAQDLVEALGGTDDVSRMTPGATALYLVALLVTRMEDE